MENDLKTHTQNYNEISALMGRLITFGGRTKIAKRLVTPEALYAVAERYGIKIYVIHKQRSYVVGIYCR